ncbi:hypothetical protein ABEB36_004746 [Hypothenemus hampei]|uniref:Uncharacterized protein n=1 Tax=Hypothenemus hampei TaxID=57062 RepID=A0ABD1F4C3_HYPHA
MVNMYVVEYVPGRRSKRQNLLVEMSKPLCKVTDAGGFGTPRSGREPSGEAGSARLSSDVCDPKEVAIQASKDVSTGMSSVIVERGAPEACGGASGSKEESSPESRNISAINTSYYSLTDTSVDTDSEEETGGFQMRSWKNTYHMDSSNVQEEAVSKFWRSPVADETEDDGSCSQRGITNKRMRDSTSPQVLKNKKYKPEEEKMTTGIAIINMYKEVEMLSQIMTKCRNPTTSLKITIKNITDLVYRRVTAKTS